MAYEESYPAAATLYIDFPPNALLHVVLNEIYPLLRYPFFIESNNDYFGGLSHN
jgi:hypothetical protein